LPPDRSIPIPLDIGGGDRLLAQLDRPASARALVVVLPGLGGCAEALGPRRLALALQRVGFATLRLNLRGAGRGRDLAGGSYAARCDRDLLPALRRAREIADTLGQDSAAGTPPLPLAAVGVSLGGTILLNACRTSPGVGLAALVCQSSPLDLLACTAAFARPRNALYQRWLVRRLRDQTLADRRGLAEAERRLLRGPRRPRTIRSFDAVITAPRWGYASVDQYYAAASPLEALRQRALAPHGASPGPPTLLLHAADDPWVPAGPTVELAALLVARGEAGASPTDLEVLVSRGGGHCGFHGVGDEPLACWSDRLTAAWLVRRLAAAV
jgi:predicted alpha/beta-fold hydrolase